MTWFNSLPGPFHHCSKLFDAVQQQSWDDVLFNVEIHPNHASRWETVGFDGKHETRLLPLHLALKLNAPVIVIEKLLDAYPEAAQMCDAYFQRLPLHIACIAGCPAEVVRLLVTAFLGGAAGRDIFGRVPLHYAIFHHYSTEVIDFLIRSFPRGASVIDYNGWLPLHVACRYGVEEDALIALLKAYPSGLNRLTLKCERTPIQVGLHFNVLDKKCIEILKNWSCETRETDVMCNDAVSA